MAIVIIRQDHKIDAWKRAIQRADPSLEVYSGNEEHPKERITMALVWNHPIGSLAEYPNLRCIASTGAGVDFIFEDETVPLHIPIVRVVDKMLADDMSEHVMSCIFNHLKNLSLYRLQQTRQEWLPKPYHRIKDQKIGIMGLGVLGSTLAIDLVRFGFQVQGWSKSNKSIGQVITFAGEGRMGEFLSTTNVLVCLLPLTNETSGVLNAELFRQLPKGAYIINVARGGHLVEADLLRAIAKGHLAGAALDVFQHEPLPGEHPFWEHKNILITPHCASITDIESVAPQILENYKRVREQLPLQHTVSRTRGY